LWRPIEIVQKQLHIPSELQLTDFIVEDESHRSPDSSVHVKKVSFSVTGNSAVMLTWFEKYVLNNIDRYTFDFSNAELKTIDPIQTGDKSYTALHQLIRYYITAETERVKKRVKKQ
jgi:hypothetical protein